MGPHLGHATVTWVNFEALLAESTVKQALLFASWYVSLCTFMLNVLFGSCRWTFVLGFMCHFTFFPRCIFPTSCRLRPGNCDHSTCVCSLQSRSFGGFRLWRRYPPYIRALFEGGKRLILREMSLCCCCLITLCQPYMYCTRILGVYVAFAVGTCGALWLVSSCRACLVWPWLYLFPVKHNLFVLC